jgi:hypothetical protein
MNSVRGKKERVRVRVVRVKERLTETERRYRDREGKYRQIASPATTPCALAIKLASQLRSGWTVAGEGGAEGLTLLGKIAVRRENGPSLTLCRDITSS